MYNEKLIMHNSLYWCFFRWISEAACVESFGDSVS